MGKLADRLREIMNRGVRPMGFAAGAPPSPPPLFLVAVVGTLGDEAAEAEAAGAAAVLAPLAVVAKDTKGERIKKLGKSLVGAQVANGDKGALKNLAKTGTAFAFLTEANTPATNLFVEGIDLVLTVDPEWTDTVARGVEQLPIEAVIYDPAAKGPISIYDQLLCARIVALTRKPVLVGVPMEWGVDALRALRDAGVMGVIVPAGDTATYAEAIRTLPPRKRAREEMAAMLPRGGVQVEEEGDEEEDRAAGTTSVDGD